MYGDYPGLSEKQIEYIKLVTNPENKLKGLTEKELTDILGIAEKSPYNWRKIPEFREAIYKEEMYKAADDLPTMLTELRKNCVQDKDPKAKNAALALWFKINGVLQDSKDGNIDKQSKNRKSVDDRMIEIADEFKDLLIQPPE